MSVQDPSGHVRGLDMEHQHVEYDKINAGFFFCKRHLHFCRQRVQLMSSHTESSKLAWENACKSSLPFYGW